MFARRKGQSFGVSCLYRDGILQIPWLMDRLMVIRYVKIQQVDRYLVPV